MGVFAFLDPIIAKNAYIKIKKWPFSLLGGKGFFSISVNKYVNAKGQKYEYIGKLIDNIVDLKVLAKENKQTLLVTPTVSEDLFIITNEDRVGLIGVSKDGKIDAYKVNVQKWIWAESEGFKPQDILSKLLADILTRCNLKEFEKHIIISL